MKTPQDVLVMQWNRKNEGTGRKPRFVADVPQNRYCSEFVRVHQDRTPAEPLPPRKRPVALLFIKAGRRKGVRCFFPEFGPEPEFYPTILGLRADGRPFFLRDVDEVIVDTREKGNGRITIVKSFKASPGLFGQSFAAVKAAAQGAPSALWTGFAILGLFTLFRSIAHALTN